MRTSIQSLRFSLFLTLIFVCIGSSVFAALRTAIQDGNWTDAATWQDGNIPAMNDDVVIPAGITVSHTGNLNNNNFFSLEVSGNLSVTGSITFTQWAAVSLTVKAGGVVDIGANLRYEIGNADMHVTIEQGGQMYVGGEINDNSAHNQRYLYNYGYLEVDGNINLDLNLYNYVSGTIWVHGSLMGTNVLRVYNYGIITIDQDFALFKTIFTNYSTGRLIVFGEISHGEGSTLINQGLVQCNFYEFTDNANAAPNDFNNTGGTFIVLEEISTTGSRCPGCNDRLGDFYYESILSAANCAPFASCADFLGSGGTQIEPGRRLWLNASFLGYGLGNDGQVVDKWFDLANSFGFKMDQPVTAKQPSLRNNSSDNVNFNPAVSFDGNEVAMDLSDSPLYCPAGDGGYVYFAVVIPTSGGAPNQSVFDFGVYAAEGYGLLYSDQNLRSYTATDAGGYEHAVIGHTYGTSPRLLTQVTQWNTSQELFVDGVSIASQAITLPALGASEVAFNASPNGTAGPFTIGAASADNASNMYNGKLAELIIYAHLPSLSVIRSTESFLAMKYGMTLPNNYTDYYGNVIYTNSAPYNNGIIALAREDLNHLHQKQSTSLLAGNNLIIATDDIVSYNQQLVATNISLNASYIVMGHNGAATPIERVYKVQTTNFDQDITLQFEFPGLSEPYPQLQVDSDDSFSSPTFESGVYAGDFLTFTFRFDDDAVRYFRVGDGGPLPVTSPGGVSDDLQLWLLSTELALVNNDNVTTWADYTGTMGNAVSTNLAPPVFKDNAAENLNFHPIVLFDGVDDGLDFGDTYFSAPDNGVTIFAVVLPNETQNLDKQFIIDIGNNPEEGLGLAFGAENAYFYAATDHDGVELSYVHARSAKPSIVSGFINFGDNQRLGIDGAYVLEEAVSLVKLEAGTELATASVGAASEGPLTIGTQSATTNRQFFDGYIAEVIAYNRNLTPIEMQRVESYLAVKYGIPLSKNYINSNEDVIWYRGVNTVFNNDIFGLAADNITLLNQKQAMSVSADDILSLGVVSIEVSNASNSASITNLDVLLVGNNKASVIATGNTNRPSVFEDRIGREWLVQETGDVGNLEIRFYLSNHGSITASDLRLVVDSDQNGAFEDTDDIYSGAVANGDYFSFTGINLADGDIFTLGTIDASQTPLKPVSTSEPGVGIGDDFEAIHTTAQLHIHATDKGVLLPSLTTAEMNSIASPPSGLIIYNSTYARYMYNSGTPAMPQWKLVGGVVLSNSAGLQSSSGEYVGEIRYNTTTDTLWFWDGTNWNELDID